MKILNLKSPQMLNNMTPEQTYTTALEIVKLSFVVLTFISVVIIYFVVSKSNQHETSK